MQEIRSKQTNQLKIQINKLQLWEKKIQEKEQIVLNLNEKLHNLQAKQQSNRSQTSQHEQINKSFEIDKAGKLDTGIQEDEKEQLGLDYKAKYENNATNDQPSIQKPKLNFKLDLSKVNEEDDHDQNQNFHIKKVSFADQVENDQNNIKKRPKFALNLEGLNKENEDSDHNEDKAKVPKLLLGGLKKLDLNNKPNDELEEQKENIDQNTASKGIIPKLNFAPNNEIETYEAFNTENYLANEEIELEFENDRPDINSISINSDHNQQIMAMSALPPAIETASAKPISNEPFIVK